MTKRHSTAVITALAVASFSVLASAQQPQQDTSPVRTVSFTENELAAAIDLFDTACKAQGMKVCQNSLALTAKIQKAVADQIATEAEVKKREAAEKKVPPAEPAKNK